MNTERAKKLAAIFNELHAINLRIITLWEEEVDSFEACGVEKMLENYEAIWRVENFIDAALEQILDIQGVKQWVDQDRLNPDLPEATEKRKCP